MLLLGSMSVVAVDVVIELMMEGEDEAVEEGEQEERDERKMSPHHTVMINMQTV